MSDEDDPWDLQRRACALCSWIILSGIRVELCSRCQPMSKTPEWRGPLPFLPETPNRRECTPCRARSADELAKIEPDAVVFCRACTSRAMSRRREAPLDYARDQTPRVAADRMESRTHWFF